MILWTVLKTFAPKCFNDNLGSTLAIYGMVIFSFLAFILQEFMEVVEAFVKKLIILFN